MADNDDFREVAKEYAELSKVIKDESKTLLEKKRKRDELAEAVLASMASTDIDEVCLPGGAGTITRKTSKRTGTLKPEYIMDELKTFTGGDEARAEAAMQRIQARRDISEKEVISYKA
jgi:LDH2 family malate/lactate/ureidoglycolate dehydrogenase